MQGSRITPLPEEEVWALAESELAEGGDWPILLKREWEPTQSAVCLKRTREGFILAASCDRDGSIRFFGSSDREAICELAERFLAEMETSGNPLSGAVAVPSVDSDEG